MRWPPSDLADLEHQVAFVGICRVGLGAAGSVDIGEALIVRFVAALVGATEQNRGVFDLLCNGERSADASVLAVIGGLGNTAPVLAFTDQVFRLKRAQNECAAKGAGTDAAGIGAAYNVNRGKR